MSVALLKALTTAEDTAIFGESPKERAALRQHRHFFLSPAYAFSNFIFRDETKSKSYSQSFADVQVSVGAAHSIC